MKISPILEVEELLKIYKNSDVMIFDVSNSKNAKANYETEHLEGALFIDLNTQLAGIKSDFSEGGRHPLPEIENFAQTLTNLGVSREKHLVIYDDTNGSNASARFWWMLKSIEHEKVQVLNGGLNQAKENHFPLSSKTEIITPSVDVYRIDRWSLPMIEMNELESISEDPNYLVIDIRSKERYEGKTEPIDLIAGNIPFTENLDHNGLFLQPNELKNKYESIFGEIKAENIVIHCGSGVTACHTLLALDYAEMEIPKLHVGSWSEWSRNNKIIVTVNP